MMTSLRILKLYSKLPNFKNVSLKVPYFYDQSVLVILCSHINSTC